MFNRSTKLTAVLLAAASIVSSVPAMAATRLDNKEGNIEDPVSFKDGKYLYQGYRDDDADNGIYYNAGDKDKKLDDVDTIGYNGITKYGDKFVSVSDGTDEYIVDLTAGKATDDDIVSDLVENTETKLKNKLKKTDRYNNQEDSVRVELLSNNRFEDAWYEYTATTAGETTGAQVKGYTNASGSYIDCSYNANIYAYKGGKTYKLENVGDTAADGAIVLNSIKHLGTIGQDDKYIYRLIEADITGAQKVNKKNPDPDAAVSEPTYYVQKVSKAQGDKEKDAYLPKTTETFQVEKNDKEEDRVVNNGDAHDAYTELMNVVNDTDHAKAAIVDGAIYVTRDDGDDKVKTFKIVLKSSEKVAYKKEDGSDKKVGIRLAKKDADKGHDAKDWTIDVNGTVWAIDDGKIMKSVKCGDFETVYTCDRSLDKLDVYDENNLIAWDESGEVYTTVQEGSDEAKKQAQEIVGEQPAPVAKTGWQKDATTGTWTLYDAVGTQLTGWQNVGGTWYYMDPANGVMVTGWKQVNGTWYYMNQSGAMTTGWQNVGGTWYYMNQSGAMTTGWQFDGANWYYMDASGAMLSNTTVDGYVLGASGAWIK